MPEPRHRPSSDRQPGILRRHALARGGTLLVWSAVAAQGAAQSTSPPAQEAPAATRVFLPTAPHSARLAARLAQLRERRHFELRFHEAQLKSVTSALAAAAGIDIAVGRATGQERVTLAARGDLTLLEVLHRLTDTAGLRVVVERSGVVRIFSALEFRKLLAVSGSIGRAAPPPRYYPQLEQRWVARAADASGAPGIDLRGEKARLLTWLAKDDNRARVLREPARLHQYHALTAAAGGRQSGDVRWFPHRVRATAGGRFEHAYANSLDEPAVLALFPAERFAAGPRGPQDFLVELIAVDMKARGFTTLDLDTAKLQTTKDAAGRTGLLYAMTTDAGPAYAAATEKNVRRPMAMILDGEVFSVPTVMTRIPGQGMISGLTRPQIDAILAAFAGGRKAK